MKTYSTYQEAKIASPEYAIFERDGVFGTDKAMVNYFEMHTCNYKECKPSDYCVTSEEFLKDGYAFVAGDFIFSSISQEVYQVDEIDCIDWNTLGEYDKVRYVLRAAALDKPKSRTKAEFEKLEFTQAWEAVKESESGITLFRDCHKNLERDEPRYMQVVYLQDVVVNWKDGNLYRKVERPIEWWEDAADFIKGNSFNIGKQARKVGDGAFYVESKMTREQWCDFARILLEQEGE